MLAVARGSHSCAAEIDLGTTTPRKKPGPENLGSGDETRELHKTRVFHQIFNAADGPEKSGFRACLTEIRPKPPSINPQTRKKSHNQNPGFARKTQVTHSPIPGLSRVSPRSRVFPGCLCCVLHPRYVYWGDAWEPPLTATSKNYYFFRTGGYGHVPCSYGLRPGGSCLVY